MAKKFTKFLLFSATVAAAAAGAYYYLQKRNEASNQEMEDFDDFDDLDEDMDDELDDDLDYDLKDKKIPSSASDERSYVSLQLENPASKVEEFFDDAEDIIDEKATIIEE